MSRTSISLRIFQGLLAVTNLGLSAYGMSSHPLIHSSHRRNKSNKPRVVHWYLITTRRGSPASLNFLVFASAFILSLLYLELAPRLCPRAAHPYGCMSVEACNTLVYFAAFIAHAVFLGSLAMCRGTVCTVGRVDSVVAAAAFCAWSASTVLAAKRMFMTSVRKSSADHSISAKTMQMQDA